MQHRIVRVQPPDHLKASVMLRLAEDARQICLQHAVVIDRRVGRMSRGLSFFGDMGSSAPRD